MREKFDGLVDHLVSAGIFLPQAIEILERSMIERAIEVCSGNQCAAAKQLGIHRNTLQRKIVEYGIGNGRRHRARKPVVREARGRRRKSPAA